MTQSAINQKNNLYPENNQNIEIYISLIMIKRTAKLEKKMTKHKKGSKNQTSLFFDIQIQFILDYNVRTL